MPNPAFKPTDSNRKTVEAMAACGFIHEDIAAVLKITRPTLVKHFRDILDTAAATANAKVGATLFKLATSGDCPAATFFWCKTRMGYRETTRQEVTGAEGGPIEIKGSKEELRARIAGIVARRTVESGD